MHTFYVPQNQIYEETATIVGSEQHHLRNVLRLGIGKTIRIIDGEGSVFTATISKIGSELTDARIEKQEFYKKTIPSITLFQGLPKHDKMELILQKTTELSVSRIVPVITERSLQKTTKNRLERWQRIVLSASKQCGLVWLPKLSEIQILQDCINTVQAQDLSLILWEKESEQHIQAVLRMNPEVESIALLIGPEGGFSENEVKEVTKIGCIPVKIGSTILRTETAAIAGIAMTNYEYKI